MTQEEFNTAKDKIQSAQRILSNIKYLNEVVERIKTGNITIYCNDCVLLKADSDEMEQIREILINSQNKRIAEYEEEFKNI